MYKTKGEWIMKSFKYLQITILLLVFIFPIEGFAQEKKLIEKANFSIQEAKQHTEQVSQLEVSALLAKTNDSFLRKFSADGSVLAISKRIGKSGESYFRFNTTFVDENGNHLGAFNNWGKGLLLPSSNGKHFVLAQILGDILEFYDFTTSRLLARHQLPWLDKIAFSRDGSRLLAKGSSGYTVYLYCFTSNGEELWAKEFQYLSFGTIAISHGGSYAAFESIVHDPQRIEMLQENAQERREISDRAHKKWRATNRERRKQGLPLVEFVMPPELSQKEWPIKSTIGPGSRSARAIIFVDRNGGEIGRTPTRKQLVKNLTFSNDGGSNFVASIGLEVILFDAAKGQETHKIELQSNFPLSLDVNKNGDIAIAARVYEPGQGSLIKLWQESQIKILWYKNSSSELRSYLLSAKKQIMQMKLYGVSFNSPGNKLLVQIGEQIIVLQMDDNEK